jgi:Ca-activated chloride channel family protein
MRIITIGLGTEKGGTIPLKKNGVITKVIKETIMMKLLLQN